VSFEVRACASLDEAREALRGISHYFGVENTPEDVERFVGWTEVDRLHAAWQDGRVVGGAGVFPFDLSVPGGATVSSAGVTVVGVLPTHRRRGILRAMMRAQMDDVHARGEAVAWLWASESGIYARYGYGLGSLIGDVELPRGHASFAPALELRGSVRLVDEREALALIPPVHEAAMRRRPGMFRRTPSWWETRRLADDPARRRGRGLLNRAVLEVDGRPAAYALYRISSSFEFGASNASVDVVEALAADDRSLAEIWRFLLDIDWTAWVKADYLPPDHPLFLLLAEPRRLRYRVNEGVFVRLVDVGEALSARAYGRSDEALVLDVRDAFCEWNAGRWRIAGASVERTDAAADLSVDVTELGRIYLGGFTWRELHAALRIEEHATGAVERADRIFGSWPKPWCPEIF
jgi:predicted acetyltransferase